MVMYHEELKDLFFDVMGESTTFIETGTSVGNGVAAALAAGYEKIYSVEILEEPYNIAVKSFEEEGVLGTKVFLYLGDTRVIFPKILQLIPTDTRSVFWIDSHGDTGVPAYEELKMIKTHSIKNHTILVDDLPLYFEVEELKKAILDINPDYKFELNPSQALVRMDYRLIAYV